MNYTISARNSVSNTSSVALVFNTFKQMVIASQHYWRPVTNLVLQAEVRRWGSPANWHWIIGEYRTYFHIGSSWGINESTVCRIVHWVEDALIHSGRFRLRGQEQLVQGFGQPVVVVDVTEAHWAFKRAVSVGSILVRRNGILSEMPTCGLNKQAEENYLAFFFDEGDGMISNCFKSLVFNFALRLRVCRTRDAETAPQQSLAKKKSQGGQRCRRQNTIRTFNKWAVGWLSRLAAA